LRRVGVPTRTLAQVVRGVVSHPGQVIAVTPNVTTKMTTTAVVRL